MSENLLMFKNKWYIFVHDVKKKLPELLRTRSLKLSINALKSVGSLKLSINALKSVGCYREGLL